MKITYKEYLHASQHVPMGCGPSYTCEICARTSAMGDAIVPAVPGTADNPTTPAQLPATITPASSGVDADGNDIPLITWTQVMQAAIVACIGAFASEIIVRRFLLTKIMPSAEMKRLKKLEERGEHK